MSAFTYPGVYIEELQSAQHTITGVATSPRGLYRAGLTGRPGAGSDSGAELDPDYQALA